MRSLPYHLHMAFFIVTLCLAGCDGIFVQDPIDPRIPQYSEKGYNAAGAFINGEIWRAVADYGFYETHNIPHLKYYPAEDSLSIYFEGSSLSYGSIVFGLSGIGGLNNFKDLSRLNNSKFTLDGHENIGSCYEANYEGNDIAVPFQGKGQLYLRKVSLLDSTEIQFSGTFNIQYQYSDGRNMQITYGRFDYHLLSSRDFEMVNNEK